jgi:hypothetical protein
VPGFGGGDIAIPTFWNKNQCLKLMQCANTTDLSRWAEKMLRVLISYGLYGLNGLSKISNADLATLGGVVNAQCLQLKLN